MSGKRKKQRAADQPSLFQMACFSQVQYNADVSSASPDNVFTYSSDDGPQEKCLKNRKLWQDAWLKDYDWLEFNYELGRVFCKLCKQDARTKSPFGKHGSWNVRTSAFAEHASSQGHKHTSWLATKGKDSLVEISKKSKIVLNTSLLHLFRCAYVIAKEDLPFAKFETLVRLLKACGVQDMTGHYQHEKACAKFVQSISKSIENSICERIKASPFFGIMADESTDISVTKHLILYATFLEGPKSVITFLGISKVVDGTAISVYDAIMEKVTQCGLDTKKFVAFGSDGASVMVGTKTGVATRLKVINPFLISLHCAAHRTNLCLEGASEDPKCIEISDFIDNLVNQVASFFSRSTNRLNLLTEMEKELEYDELHAEGIQKTRWLSRHRAIKKLCNILEPLLAVLKEEKQILYDKLRDFKIVYILHFLADILQHMTELSLDFQKNFVDVTIIGSLCNKTVREIEHDFLQTKVIDLNGFDLDSKGYPIIPDHGEKDGMLAALRGAVKGNMYRGIEMIRSRIGIDLNAALEFQDAFSQAVIKSLKKRLEEQHIVSCLKVLAPINLPTRAKELKNFGTNEIIQLADFFGVDKRVNGKVFPALIDRHEFLKK